MPLVLFIHIKKAGFEMIFKFPVIIWPTGFARPLQSVQLSEIVFSSECKSL